MNKIYNKIKKWLMELGIITYKFKLSFAPGDLIYYVIKENDINTIYVGKVRHINVYLTHVKIKLIKGDNTINNDINTPNFKLLCDKYDIDNIKEMPDNPNIDINYIKPINRIDTDYYSILDLSNKVNFLITKYDFSTFPVYIKIFNMNNNILTKYK